MFETARKKLNENEYLALTGRQHKGNIIYFLISRNELKKIKRIC